jgi:hypothetical protein
MDKVSVFLLVVSPYLAFFGWAIWWLVTDGLCERRRARAAGCAVEPAQGCASSQERSHGEQASAA